MKNAKHTSVTGTRTSTTRQVPLPRKHAKVLNTLEKHISKAGGMDRFLDIVRQNLNLAGRA